MADSSWLPALILLENHNGDWARYVETVYAVFHNDFIRTQPMFQQCWVRCRRDPLEQGKEAGFWHCTSSGLDESHRTPEIRRMERIGWVRAIVEHPAQPEVNVWVRHDGHEPRWHLWFNEEFMVVLGERTRKRDGFRYFQLITAFDTPYDHQKRKRRHERDLWSSRNG